MQKHGQGVVVGGPLAGSQFSAFTDVQLAKAAKRCPSDPRLQKMAKACVTIKGLDGQTDPKKVQASANVWHFGQLNVRTWIWGFVSHRYPWFL